MERKHAVSRRALLGLLATSGAGLLVAGCGATRTSEPVPEATATTVAAATVAEPTAAVSEAVTIEYWDPSSSEAEQAKLDASYFKFHDAQSAIRLNVLHGKGEDALLAAVAANTPPDIYWRYDVMTFGSWINKGVVQDITPYTEASTLDWSRFVPISLEACKWRGKFYGMPSTSAGLGLYYWNKPIFEKSGLDPEVPPKSLEELMEFSDKLTTKDDSGNIGLLGFHWNIGFIQWPPHFNCKFWDPDAERITSTDEGIIASFQWLADFYDHYGVDKVDRFIAGLPEGGYYSAAHPLCADLVGSIAGFEWDMFNMIATSGCEKSKFGFTKMVTPAAHPDWPTCSQGTIALTMPTGNKHPNEAWVFVEFLQRYDIAGQIGADVYCTAQVKDAVELQAYRDNDVLALASTFADNVIAWPCTIPVAAEYGNELGKAFDLIIHGKVAAEEGLQGVYDMIQPELDRALGK